MGMAKALGFPDWKYKDLPRMTPEFNIEFRQIVGEENIKWITFATYPKSGTCRGQILISPAGMTRLKEYNDTN